MEPLAKMREQFPQTQLWNDSCSKLELQYALKYGAVGATTNPVIVYNVLKQEWKEWEPLLKRVIQESPAANEDEIAWKVIEQMGLAGATLLEPVFQKGGGKKGYLSMQTNPKNYRNSRAMVEQAVYFSKLAPNIQVKMPVTQAGVEGIEEATAKGVSINATVSFTLPQMVAVAEAIERGLKRAEPGINPDKMNPVCTIMVGRIDDYLKTVASQQGVTVDPAALEWAGISIAKKAYRLFKERGYRTKVLIAAYRNHMHWSQFIGGDIVLTIPHNWQVKFNNSDIDVKERIDAPVPKEHLKTLKKYFPEFDRAYREDGLKVEEFDTYGATQQTLLQFLTGYESLLQLVRPVMVSG